MIIRRFLLLILFVLSADLTLAQDMPLTQVLLPGEGWELVADGFEFTEGPVADADGRVFFTDIPNSRIHRIDLDGKLTVFAENTARTNGLAFGPDGRLYGCRNGDRQIVAYNADGTLEVLASDVASNDLAITRKGVIFFTDPRGRKVYRLTPEQTDGKTNYTLAVVAEGINPNGVALWRGDGTLVVTEREEPWLWTWRIEKDGSLSARERYYSPLVLPPGMERPGSDGMAVDDAGRLYVATRMGVQMFDPTGRLGGVISRPQPKALSNVTFGGKNFDVMYATSQDKVYRRKTRTASHPHVFGQRRKQE